MITQRDLDLIQDPSAFGLARPDPVRRGWVAELVFLILVFGVAICL